MGHVPEVGLQAERELQQPGPFSLHGGQKSGFKHILGNVHIQCIFTRIIEIFNQSITHLHGGQVRLDDLVGGVVGLDQGVSPVQDRVELGLPPLELGHEVLVVALNLAQVQIPVRPVPEKRLIIRYFFI